MRRPLCLLFVVLILTLALWATPLLAAETVPTGETGPSMGLFAGVLTSLNNRTRIIQISLVAVAFGCFILMKR